MSNTLFRDIPAEKYPFVIEYLNTEGDVVHVTAVAGPGLIKVPALGRVSVRILWGDGTIEDTREDQDGN